MKQNPFLIDKYFDDVKNNKIKAQDAVNLTAVLASNKLEMLRMIKNAGVSNIKDLYQKCSKNFEKITQQKPKANMFAQYAIKRPKQDIQYSKQVDQRKLPIRKTESAGKSFDTEPIRKNSRTNSKDQYEKMYNLQDNENQKMVDDVMQMMLIMAEHIQHQQIEEQKKIDAEQQYKQQQQQIKQNHEIFSKQSQQQQLEQQQKQNQAEKSPIKRKISVPQIRIIVSSPPKEVQTEPYLALDDHIKLDDFPDNHNSFSNNNKNNKSSNISQIQNSGSIEDDDDIPEENTENIIESTLFKFNQQFFDVSRISGHIREHTVQL